MTDVLDYAPILADLERRRDELTQAIATLRAVASMPPDEAPASSTVVHKPSTNGAPHLRRDQFFGMTSPDAVKAYLSFVKQPRTAARIAADIVEHGFNTSSTSPANTIRTTLGRLADAGEVVQVKGKEWGLLDWYPGLRKRARRDEDVAPGKADGKAPAHEYRSFVAEKMAKGMTMKDAAAAWRQQQGK